MDPGNPAWLAKPQNCPAGLACSLSSSFRNPSPGHGRQDHMPWEPLQGGLGSRSLPGPGPCIGAADHPNLRGQVSHRKLPRPRLGRGFLSRARLAHPGQEPAMSPAGPRDLLSILECPVGQEQPWLSVSVHTADLAGAALAAWVSQLAASPALDREQRQ